MPHQVVLEQLHLLRLERDPDVPADAGVHAIDAFAARQQLFQPLPPQSDARARCLGDPHLHAFARHAHHILNGKRARSQFQNPGHGLLLHYSTVNVCRVSTVCPPTASLTVTAIVYSPGRVVWSKVIPMLAPT